MSKPSILFINRVFPPDHGATGRCLHDLAGRFAAAGWRVTVLACGEPDADAAPSAGVDVVRARNGIKIGSGLRMAGYLSAFCVLLTSALRLPRHDVVVTMTDPPMLAALGPMLRLRWGCALIHWSHDLYPDLLPVLGVHLPRPVGRLLHRVSRSALDRHDAVVAIGDCMAAQLAATGLERSRITVIPNWADPVIRPVARSTNRFRAELGLGDRFTVAYSGNFGLAHPLDALLNAADAMVAQAPDIAFLLIGEGRGHDRIATEVARRALPNVRLLPWQPADRLAESLGAADLHVAAMAEEATGLLVPSKVAGVLAAGRPCVLLGSAQSTAGRLIERHGCGKVLAPRDGRALAGTILRFARDAAFWRETCARAVAAAAIWNADEAAQRFVALAARVGSAAPDRDPALKPCSLVVMPMLGDGDCRV